MAIPVPPPPILVQAAAPTPWWDHSLFAAFITGAVAILVLGVNSWLNTSLHREKLKADRDLAREKFAYDKQTAEHKAQLDRDLDKWRRRVAFAEEQLTAFYEARSRLHAIRSPLAYSHEAEARQGRDQESEDVRQYRDMYYPVIQRINDAGDFFNGFYSKRYLAVALLGAPAEAPYVAMWQQLVKVNAAVASLLRLRPDLGNQDVIDHRHRMEEVIWEGVAGDKDVTATAINQAVSDAEAIFRPVIQPPPG